MIERRDGSGSFPLYEVWIDGQGPFVARKDVFNIAQMMENTQVDAITRDEERNGYLNHYLDFVSSAGQTTMQQPNPAVQAQQAQPQTAQEALSEPTAAEERKNLSIHRQTATKVAAQISKTQQEFWFNVEELLRFYQSGVKPFQNRPVTPDPIPRENHQNAAAYRQYRDEPDNQYTGDPGSQLPPPEDSDIPF